MIKKLHKIPDRVFFRSVIVIIILWNLKYFVMPLQVLYTAITQNYRGTNNYYSKVNALRSEIKKYPDFYDEGQIGFVSDKNGVNVFLNADTIQAFFISQYAVVPSIMKNDTNKQYVIGAFYKTSNIPKGFVVLNKISDNFYLLKKEGGIND